MFTDTPCTTSPCAITMLTPNQTCEQLHIDDQGLLSLVNSGDLAAYNFGGQIRFRALDVQAASTGLVAA